MIIIVMGIIIALIGLVVYIVIVGKGMDVLKQFKNYVDIFIKPIKMLFGFLNFF